MPEELNPNHSVTQSVHDHWHKLCAAVMVAMGVTSIEITQAHVEEFARILGTGGAVVCDTRGGKLVLRLVGPAEARKLAREEGGLPH